MCAFLLNARTLCCIIGFDDDVWDPGLAMPFGGAPSVWRWCSGVGPWLPPFYSSPYFWSRSPEFFLFCHLFCRCCGGCAVLRCRRWVLRLSSRVDVLYCWNGTGLLASSRCQWIFSESRVGADKEFSVVPFKSVGQCQCNRVAWRQTVHYL
ncbi:hypothetical protein P691DRAFT_161993 [Macrolepiota fuliginosa MF-IS2]|uniref:Uncharacterized protein n=1 Tax=Macrolepiota fuliginosa MF-IS2 TaxID=1400762 RepID=A0A9P6C901_9AGAR|nr:hypothetical protein P691DRAFT_161993 [Macrolepiota fuliginosa MF-IS2]